MGLPAELTIGDNSAIVSLRLLFAPQASENCAFTMCGLINSMHKAPGFETSGFPPTSVRVLRASSS
jgi:hypothetical protein